MNPAAPPSRMNAPESLGACPALDGQGAIAGSVHLVGRRDELVQLGNLYARVAAGDGPQIAWITGVPGIGKSALARALCGQIVDGVYSRASLIPYIAAGKCTIGSRDVPFSAVSCAIRPLLARVLECAPLELDAWRDRLVHAARPVGATLSSLLPELGIILQLPEESFAREAFPSAHRLEREVVLCAFSRVIAAFAKAERPLVLVMDDLQWADADSLQVLKHLVLAGSNAPFLLVGTVRDQGRGRMETTSLGSLLSQAGALRLSLNPLDSEASRQLIARLLPHEGEGLEGLSTLVAESTKRNPFCIRRLMARLTADGTISFDSDHGCWVWDRDELVAVLASANGATLALRELDSLPAVTHALLCILSCLGDASADETLACAAHSTPTELGSKLSPALLAGVIVRERGTWAFAHDHFRETIYASMSEDQRAWLHLRIARRLRAEYELEEGFGFSRPWSHDQLLYLTAMQANLGRRGELDSAAEGRAFAVLNLEAARRARAATAHQIALTFLRWALLWFGEDRHSQDALEASLSCAEAEFFTGDLPSAEARLRALQLRVRVGFFGVEVARLRCAIYTALGRYSEALDVGLMFLDRAGFSISRRPDDRDVALEYAFTQSWLDHHGVSVLRDIPQDPDPLRRATLNIFADLIPPALYSNQCLVDLILLRMMRLVTEHGHFEAAANGYVCMVQVLGARFGDYERSKEFGELALSMVERPGMQRYRARVLHTYATFVIPWTRPGRTAREYFDRAFEIATQVGDHTFALYCARNRASGMLFAGEFLEDVRHTVERGLKRARDADYELVINALLSQRSLLGELQDGHYGGPEMAEPPEDAPCTVVDLAYWTYKLQLAVIFADPARASECHRRAQKCRSSARAFAEYADLAFYGALSLVRLTERDAIQQRALEDHLDSLRGWELGCPQNFGARRLLVEAELERAGGRDEIAASLYADAVGSARQNGLLQIEALAAELASEFHLGRGKAILSRSYLRLALTAWHKWGARAKAIKLQGCRAAALADEEPESTMPAKGLALQDVLRVTQDLAGSIVAESLVESAMRRAIELSGAEYGVLAVYSNEHWSVQARAQTVQGRIMVMHEPTTLCCKALPISLARAVAADQQTQLIEDAAVAPFVASDPYVLSERPISMLCVPMMRFGTFAGVLYLETHDSQRRLSAARVDALEGIASEAAFSVSGPKAKGGDSAEPEHFAPELRLRKALAEVALSNQVGALEELMASIVHEIGQPLSSIATSASAGTHWLKRSSPQIDEAVQMFSHISLSADRAKAIMKGLRNLARRTKQELVPVDLGEALRECASLIGVTLSDLGVTLLVDGPDAPCVVLGDRIQLQQLAINLLMNGAEAMIDVPQESKVLSMTWLCEEDGFIAVEMLDRGPGIPAEMAPRVMEPFFTTKPQGMGMGLIICRSIVEAHRATLEFQPGPQGGTAVRIRFPPARGPVHAEADTGQTGVDALLGLQREVTPLQPPAGRSSSSWPDFRFAI